MKPRPEFSRFEPASAAPVVPRRFVYALEFLVATALASLALPLQLELSPSQFFPLHTAMEVFGVVICGLVFAVGWNAAKHGQSFSFCIIACNFMVVGLLDLGHLLSYEGMPEIVTPASPQKAIAFWLVARLVCASALLAATLYSGRGPTTAAARRILLSAALALSALTYWAVLLHPEGIPLTFVPGRGLTPLKIGVEYLVLILHLATAAVLWVQMKRQRNFEGWWLLGGLIAMAISHFFFTLYGSMNDFFILIGHVYKVAAYVAIYQAVFVAGIRKPYEAMAVAERHEREAVEGALRESEARFRGMADTVPCVIYTKGVDGRLDFLNRRFWQYTGLREGDADKLHWQYALHPQDRARLDQTQVMAEKAQTSYSIELRLRSAEGDYRWFAGGARPVFGETAVLERWFGAFVDIDGLKRQEAALRQSEERFRAVFEYAPCGIALLSLSGRFLRANSALCRLLDYSADELGATAFSQVTHPEARERDSRLSARLIAGEIESYTLDTRCIRKNGEPVWTQLTVSLLRDSEGNPSHAVAVVEDIEKRKQEERELKLAGQILTASGEGIAILDENRVILSVNPAFTALTGYEEDEAAGRSARLVVSADGVNRLDAAFSRFRRTGKLSREELQGRRKHGEEFTAIVGVSGVTGSDGRVVRYVLSFVDISERKHAEDLLRETDRRKDEFLAMLAHELRNPLAPIVSAADILRRLPLQDSRLDKVRDILERQSHHLARLVDDLLDVSRITRGKVVLRRKPLLLADLVERAVETVRPLAAARGHKLSVLVPPHPVVLEGDEVRLTQVIANILTNAAKYTRDGGCIGVNAQYREGQAIIRVTDNGIGIAPSLLPHVFDLFTQAERSLDRSEGGLGIGLTIVKSLVEMHRGSVAVESEPGRGSTFEVRLPATTEEVANPLCKQPAGAEAPPLRLLIVEDNPDAAESLALLLRLSGHEVQVASDGFAGIEIARNHCLDAILLDIGLPGMDGFELARELKSLPETRTLCLIAVTGYGQPDEGRCSPSGHFDHFLVKPVDAGALASVLARLSAARAGGMPAGHSRAGV